VKLLKPFRCLATAFDGVFLSKVETMEIKNATVRVYITKSYFKTGVLSPYFYEDSSNDDLPAMFRSTNCEFDKISNCYKFQIPQLNDSAIVEDVYIPREFVLGLNVKHGQPSQDDTRKHIGFVRELTTVPHAKRS
jgi:hypothetical protein